MAELKTDLRTVDPRSTTPRTRAEAASMMAAGAGPNSAMVASTMHLDDITRPPLAWLSPSFESAPIRNATKMMSAGHGRACWCPRAR